MKGTRFALAAMVLGTALGASQAKAQCDGNAGTCNTTNTASVTVGALVKLGMSSPTTTLTPPTADQVDGGLTVGPDAGPDFTIKSNRSWTLKIKAGVSPNWNYSGSFVGVKPISDLLWSNASGGTYAAIATTDATFTSGASSTNGATATPYFKTLWTADFTSASNLPGTYSLPIVFTLTAP